MSREVRKKYVPDDVSREREDRVEQIIAYAKRHQSIPLAEDEQSDTKKRTRRKLPQGE